MIEGLVSVAFVALVISHFSVHGVAKSAPNPTQEYLDAHNQARAQVGWVLSNGRGQYGGNQLRVGGGIMSPRLVVESWVEQKKYYNHPANSCAQNHTCGSYTQVVWRKSLELGCAMAVCGNVTASLTVCFYNPPGNYYGQSPY
ncbi:STS14 protein [Vitis vinifera]|uniref:STS14 protein n=1 Tax=Vitis vinifera TaxID=29760 RepID=A0A438FB34_VITVI|nr:STS14 protein [Vitis vinifera]